jgi:hypothetical protein
MPLTNNYGLPAPLVAWLSNDQYKLKADYSATGLINPPQVEALKRKYKEVIVRDAAELIWMALGSAVHSILEDTPGFQYLRENTMRIDYDGTLIQMTPDLYDMDECRLWDYKVTSVWAVARGLKEDWEAQVNMYAYGLAKEGHRVKEAKVMAILRDWSLMEKFRNHDYPDVQVSVMDVPLWTLDKIDSYISERIKMHNFAKDLEDDELADMVPCSEHDMWAKPDTFACMKQGNKRASRVLSSYNDAHAWIADKGKGADFQVVHRHGERTRCEYYCEVKDFCHQYRNYKGE